MLDLFIEYMQYEKDFSAHTVLSYKKDIEGFQDYYATINRDSTIIEAEEEDIRLWSMELIGRRGLKSTTVRRKISALKSFYNYLKSKGIIESNPAYRTPIPKKPDIMPVFFTDEQIDNLSTNRAFESDNFETVRNALIIEFLYQTGLRRSEMIHVRFEDLDLVRKSVKVLGKGKKERIVPLGDNLVALIKHYLEVKNSCDIVSENSKLFVLKNGKEMYPKAVYNIVTRELGAITTKLKHSPHTLRHTFATTLLNGGAQLNSIKELLGHSSLAATQIYAHTSFDALKKIYAQTHPRAKK